MPVARYVEYLTPSPYLEEIITEPFKVDAEGYLPIPDKPGLGIELNRDGLEKVRMLDKPFSAIPQERGTRIRRDSADQKKSDPRCPAVSAFLFRLERIFVIIPPLAFLVTYT